MTYTTPIPFYLVEEYLKGLKHKCRAESVVNHVFKRMPQFSDVDYYMYVHSNVLVKLWQLRDEGKVEQTSTDMGTSSCI